MAAPFKRLCLQAARQHTIRQWHSQQPFRSISNTAIKPATPQTADRYQADETALRTLEAPAAPSDAELDLLTNKPGVVYTTTEEADDLGAIDIDALSSQAQRELAQHRELREMVRLVAWEMPRLTELSRAFEAPDFSEQPLRWRYTTYMGEAHPAESKVVLEFKPQRLRGLKAGQREKLIKIAGVRYNPNTRTVKMSCESFDTQAQNKRFLAETLLALVEEASDPDADSFADVPFDTRHVKVKNRLRFPPEWRMTTERRALLEEKRSEALMIEARRVEQGQLVSGVAAIEEARRLQLEKEREAAEAAMQQTPEDPILARYRMGPDALKRQARSVGAQQPTRRP